MIHYSEYRKMTINESQQQQQQMDKRIESGKIDKRWHEIEKNNNETHMKITIFL